MKQLQTSTPPGLKAVILAGGRDSDDGQAGLLKPLGSQKIIDYMIRLGLQLVDARNLYVVVGHLREQVQQHLGPGYNYVIQDKQLGTGHAVAQLQPLLEDFRGDLFILFGDTPLLRPATVRGLLNRHRLRQSHVTLLTAIVDHPLPYGRIIRDTNNRIIDIVEEQDACENIRKIQELNAGACIVKAEKIFPVLVNLSQSPHSKHRLTDGFRHMIRMDLSVESYRLYDQDEVLGINTQPDLEQAEFILQKRLYQPRRHEEQNLVTFGTGGWRAIIGEGFTLHNVRRLSQAIANEIIRTGKENQGVVIGYDRRFLSDWSADASAEVFAGNNIPVVLMPEDAPTPQITYATAVLNAAFGLAFTASHNPPEWNGLKVFHGDGSFLQDDETKKIEMETNALRPEDVVKIDLQLALEARIVIKRDFTNDYVDAVEKLVDLDVIRDAGLKVIVDPMYGVGQLTLGIVLNDARCRVAFIHERRNPLFGGRSPAPDLEALRQLMTLVRDDGYDLGLATDGDADRIAIVDENGRYVPINDILLLIYWYLHQVRGERGAVVRNLATTHMLDRLAKHFGEACFEVPVGFKHITAAMVQHNALMGGESSGGLTIRGHILGKDGIFAAALVVEMLAKTKKTISELLSEIYQITGRLYTAEKNIKTTPSMRVIIPKKMKQDTPKKLGPLTVERVSHVDGTKLLCSDDNWALIRFSGTEPVLRLFAEAESEALARELLASLELLVFNLHNKTPA